MYMRTILIKKLSLVFAFILFFIPTLSIAAAGDYTVYFDNIKVAEGPNGYNLVSPSGF